MIENIAPFIGLGMLTLFVAFLIFGLHVSEKNKKYIHKPFRKRKE